LDLLVSPEASNLSTFDLAGLLKTVLAQFRINRDGAHGTGQV
jgi:hypothetical protein